MCDTFKFKQESELESFLYEVLNKLNQKGEFNIFLHQINEGGYKAFGVVNGINLKIKSILKHGFFISNYSSICGTARLLGSSKQAKVDEILDYRYYQNHSDISICVIAIPKYIECNGKKLEYSSFEGKSNHDLDDKLRESYGRLIKYIPDSHHRKCSLFDAIKGYKELPKCYFLGVLKMNYQTDEYEFINPETHLIFKNDSEIKLHDKEVVDKITALYDKHQTKDMSEIIVKSYKEEESIRSAESDFDF